MTAPTTMQIPGLRGDVIAPDHDGYDDARAVWNGTVDRRPRLIARCSGTADVAAAVLRPRPRPRDRRTRRGHNVAGTACDDGIVIDLSAMRAVTVDPSDARPSSRAAPSGAMSTTRRRYTVWPPRAASWATPASTASAWAAASAGSCASTG